MGRIYGASKGHWLPACIRPLRTTRTLGSLCLRRCPSEGPDAGCCLPNPAHVPPGSPHIWIDLLTETLNRYTPRNSTIHSYWRNDSRQVTFTDRAHIHQWFDVRNKNRPPGVTGGRMDDVWGLWANDGRHGSRVIGRPVEAAAVSCPAEATALVPFRVPVQQRHVVAVIVRGVPLVFQVAVALAGV